MRKKPVEGHITIIGGPAGLPMQPGKKVELTIVRSDRLAKIFKCRYDLEWNYVKIDDALRESTRIDMGIAMMGTCVRA